jgi:MATE family multidrug resistance protein
MDGIFTLSSSSVLEPQSASVAIESLPDGARADARNPHQDQLLTDQADQPSSPPARPWVNDVVLIVDTAVPLAWATLCTVFLMLSLSFFGGRISMEALAAVGINEIVMLVVAIQPGFGLTSGGGTRMAHLVGAGSGFEVGIVAQQTFVIAAAAGVVGMPVVWFSGGFLRDALGVDAEVARQVTRLNRIMILYPVLFFITQTLNNYVIAVKQAKLVSYPSVFIVTLTPALLYLLIEVWGLGIDGIALGWMFACFVEFAVTLGLALHYNIFADSWGGWCPRRVFNRAALTNHAKVCLTSVALFVSAWTAMEVVFLYMATYLSACELATSTIIHQTRFAFFVGAGSWYTATAVAVAHKVGQRDPLGAERLTKTSVKGLAVLCGAQALVVFSVRSYVPHLFSDEACVQRAYTSTVTIAIAEQSVESAFFLLLLTLRSLHQGRQAVALTVVSWWLVSMACVFVLGTFVRDELRMNVGFLGVLVGQIAGLAGTYRKLWPSCASVGHSPSSPEPPPTVWFLAVEHERALERATYLADDVVPVTDAQNAEDGTGCGPSRPP